MIFLCGFASSAQNLWIFRCVDFECWWTLFDNANRIVHKPIANCEWCLQDKMSSNVLVHGLRLLMMITWPCQLQCVFTYGDLHVSQQIYRCSYQLVCMSTHALLLCSLAMFCRNNNNIHCLRCCFNEISNTPTQA